MIIRNSYINPVELQYDEVDADMLDIYFIIKEDDRFFSVHRKFFNLVYPLYEVIA